jgi:hypothetical protein
MRSIPMKSTMALDLRVRAPGTPEAPASHHGRMVRNQNKAKNLFTSFIQLIIMADMTDVLTAKWIRELRPWTTPIAS